jgi:hypothetical protein
MPGYPAQSRTDAFGEGAPSLAGTQAAINGAIPRKFTPNGVHQPAPVYSGIGSSEADKARLVYGSTPVGGALPTDNGSSVKTYGERRPFMSTSVSL